MWCKHCRQDVPGVSSPNQSGVRCTQCGRTSADPQDAASAARLSDLAENGIDLGAARGAKPQASQFDEWKFDQEVRQWQSKLGRQVRFDRPRPGQARANRQPQWHAHAAHSSVPRPHRRRNSVPKRSSGAVLFVLSLGMLTFIAGGALVAGSFVLDRPDLWSRGLPLAIAGQVGILLALALQLERLWVSSRSTVRKLNDVDAQLEQLGRNADMLHSPALHDYYAHSARPSSPHVMLADLKGQLDRIADSIARNG